jgi:hypothetical protein
MTKAQMETFKAKLGILDGNEWNCFLDEDSNHQLDEYIKNLPFSKSWP